MLSHRVDTFCLNGKNDCYEYNFLHCIWLPVQRKHYGLRLCLNEMSGDIVTVFHPKRRVTPDSEKFFVKTVLPFFRIV